MISRRNFAIISILMLIILALFQFSEVAKNVGNNYAINKNLEAKYPSNNQFKSISLSALDTTLVEWEGRDYVLFIGDLSSNIGSIVEQWTVYTKRNLLECKYVSEFDIDKFKKPEVAIIDPKNVDFDKDLDAIIKMTEDGLSLVFTSLPDVAIVKPNEKLKRLLGISYVKEDSFEIEGIKLFSGFLFGGETIYKPEKKDDIRRQDLKLNVPWIVTSGATKTYMVGILDEYFGDDANKNDLLPALIWRNSISADSQVFCIAGDYMETTAGIGILGSMIYELSDYQLYPIVNAQNTLLISYPLLANENDEELNKIYSRSYDNFQSGIIWASLVAAQEKYKLKYTAFLSPKYRYKTPAEIDLDKYAPYLSFFNEKGTEVGYSFIHDDSVSLLDKVEADALLFEQLENRYMSTSAFLDLEEKPDLKEALKGQFTKNIRTVACDEDVQVPILSYLTDDITLQSLTSNTENFTYSRDLMLKSVETALGYDNAKLDFTKVAWPEDEKDHWENIYDDMSSSLATFWDPFRVFDRTTLSESDQRVRTFLNIESSSNRSGDLVNLSISGREGQTCYFVLRTHGYVLDSVSENVSFSEIEDYAYLLRIDCDDVTIALKNALDLR